MRIRFFNAHDPHSPPDPVREVLLIGIASDLYPPPQGGGGEVFEAVRVATAADVQTWGTAYQAYVTAQEAAQKAEKEAGHASDDKPEDQVLTPPGMPPADPVPPPHPAQASHEADPSHEAQASHAAHPAPRVAPPPPGRR
jgi:hypothetical protein